MSKWKERCRNSWVDNIAKATSILYLYLYIYIIYIYIFMGLLAGVQTFKKITEKPFCAFNLCPFQLELLMH